mmetsp:Transcript_2406/g.4723  ORF Transcript_2406/g.4723 Transcript_2406/m.4723 type:complete len:134 (-) Transcript_2406:2469-2870(-)
MMYPRGLTAIQIVQVKIRVVGNGARERKGKSRNRATPVGRRSARKTPTKKMGPIAKGRVIAKEVEVVEAVVEVVEVEVVVVGDAAAGPVGAIGVVVNEVVRHVVHQTTTVLQQQMQIRFFLTSIKNFDIEFES